MGDLRPRSLTTPNVHLRGVETHDWTRQVDALHPPPHEGGSEDGVCDHGGRVV